MRISPASDHSLLVTLGAEIAPAIHREVLRLCRALDGLPGIRNLHPGYATVLVTFDPLQCEPQSLAAAIRERYAQTAALPLPEPRTIEIPVVYGGEYGPDLDAVAALHQITTREVIALHSGPAYLVYFLGFSPGFPYLGGLPPALATPRLETPRRHVPAGSVAIGGSQTGVYPVSSPGGWRIIGRTPLRLFRPDRTPPALLRMGDHVKFAPVPKWPRIPSV